MGQIESLLGLLHPDSQEERNKEVDDVVDLV